MGSVEFDSSHGLIIYSHIITYGNAADPVVTGLIREEIETMWNEPQAVITIRHEPVRVSFCITAVCNPAISEDEIIQNTDPRNNYFRIENFAAGNISFVDGLGCNTGYF